jgi:hypothetical protein
MNTEIWKPVVGFEGSYEVSSFGGVRSLTRYYDQVHPRNPGDRLKYSLPGKILAPTTDKLGRKQVPLSSGAKVTPRRVHQLVAEAFLGFVRTGTSKGLVVDHIDSNPSNNRLENLQIIAQRLNCSRSKRRSLPTGVRKRDRKTPYYVSIKINGKETYVGSYNTVDEAAEAYRRRAMSLTIATPNSLTL